MLFSPQKKSQTKTSTFFCLFGWAFVLFWVFLVLFSPFYKELHLTNFKTNLQAYKKQGGMVGHGKLWHVTHGKQARHSLDLSGEVKLLT